MLRVFALLTSLSSYKEQIISDFIDLLKHFKAFLSEACEILVYSVE